MDRDGEQLPEEWPSLGSALRIDAADPEVEQARAAVRARLLGGEAEPQRIGRFVVLERIGRGGMGSVFLAYDPQLDRRVAVKLLLPRGSLAAERDRLVAEAKAMARLTHPHVVHLYEVGEHHGRLFVAMEYVRGQTLRQWCAASPRTPAEILVVCMQAGEGLAAAHAAGIVHRDFKPDNVVVGDERDGPRARVLDFGLARAIPSPTTPDDDRRRPPGHDATSSTTGAAGGTPGYAAPEQLRGEAADVRSDQFSFCVTVWEALTGVLPFAAGQLEATIDGTTASITTAPRARMPPWVEQILRRGLADDRDASDRGRWPGLDELLRALARDPARVRRRWAAAAVVAVAVAGAFAIGNRLSNATPAGDPCGGGPDEIAGAWPEAARTEALARIAGLGGEYGPAVVPLLTAHAEQFVADWAAGHRDACMAHARGEQSDELLDRRMTCLQRSRADFAAFGRRADHVDADELPQLVVARKAVRAPSICSELDILVPVPEPAPADADAFIERYAELRMQYTMDDVDEAIDGTQQLVERARASGYRPHIALALELHAAVAYGRNTSRAEIAAELMEATTLWLAIGDDRSAIVSWGFGAFAVARAGEDIEFEGRAVMTALVERHAEERVAVEFWGRMGGIAVAQARLDDARTSFRRGIELGERSGAKDMATLYEGLALVTEDPDERDRLFARGVELIIRDDGAEHPKTLNQRATAAANLSDDHESLRQLEAVCADRRRLHPEHHHPIAMCEKHIVIGAELLGRADLARQAAQRWAEFSSRDRPLATATAALLTGDPASAVASIEPVVREDERDRSADWPFWTLVEHGGEELVLGRAWWALGDPRANAMLDAALADFEHGAQGLLQPALHRMLAHARRVVADLRRTPQPGPARPSHAAHGGP